MKFSTIFLAISLLVTFVTSDNNGTSIEDDDKYSVPPVNATITATTTTTTTVTVTSEAAAAATDYQSSVHAVSPTPSKVVNISDSWTVIAAVAAEVNATNANVTSSPQSSNVQTSWSCWWHWHNYVFGLSFTFLGALSFYTLTHNLVCMAASQRGHLTISNVLLGVACILRSVYLLDSRNVQNDGGAKASASSVAYNTLVYECPTSLLVSSMMFYVGGLGTYTQAQWSRSRTCTTMFAVNLLATPYLITCWSIVAVVVVLRERIDSTTTWSLSLLLKLSSLFWCIVFAVITFALFKDIRKASLRKQSQIIRATLTKLHIDGTQLPKKLPKPCLGLAAKTIAVTSVLSLITCVVLLVGVALECDDSPIVFRLAAAAAATTDTDENVFDSSSRLLRVKITWIYYHVIRLCEAAMCCSLTCGLFWSQCGHQCRRRALGDVTIATFWSGLRKRSVWYVAPSASVTRRRHSSDDDDGDDDVGVNTHPYCSGGDGDHHNNHNHNHHHNVTGGGSSHAVSRTNFTFERWERSRLPQPPPPMNQVPVADAHFPNVQPILRTFQNHHNHHSNRISPQHRLQTHLRSSTMALQRTGRTVSTTVVAGLRSLTRSRRSSSSSSSSASSSTISSGSSLRPPPARPPHPLLPQSDDGDDERKQRARHHVGCNKRFCCCGRCGGSDKRVVVAAATASSSSKHGKSAVVSSAAATTTTSHAAKKQQQASTRRKHRHLTEIGKRKIRDVDVANKVLMVSRATQVYIPSPQKCGEDGVPQNDDDQTTTTTSKRVFGQWSSSSIGGRGAVRVDPRESSTSCSSESAANSFDVRFYMHGTATTMAAAASPRDTSANEGSSSPSHYFHERFYGQRLNVPYKSFQRRTRRRRDSLDEMSCSSHDMVTVCRRKFVPRFQSTDVINRSRSLIEHQMTAAQNEGGHPSTTTMTTTECSVLDLKLPLNKGRCCPTVASKNQQDITPDSAVYLELNSPEDTVVTTKMDLPGAWCTRDTMSNLPRSISLTELHRRTNSSSTIAAATAATHDDDDDRHTKATAGNIRRISAATTTATNTSTMFPTAEIVHSKMSSVSKTMLFKQPSDDVRRHVVTTTSLDSLYDSGDDVVSAGSSNCNREHTQQGGGGGIRKSTTTTTTEWTRDAFMN